MPDHSNHETTALDSALAAEAPPRVRRRRTSPRTDWRLGGRTVLLWREPLLAIALLSLGAGVIVGALLDATGETLVASLAGLTGLWLGMLVPVLWAFTRSRPAGLLRWRWIDLLWGVGFAIIVRLTQGWLEVAFGESGALPSYPRIGGALASDWLFTDVIAVIGIAPVVEEFFFRAVILIAVFTALRRPLGRLFAGVIAVLVSTGIFVLVHAVDVGASVDQVLATTVLGLVCGALVALTGRLWGAVLVHMLYNASFVALALAGTVLG